MTQMPDSASWLLELLKGWEVVSGKGLKSL